MMKYSIRCLSKIIVIGNSSNVVNY